jgi:hypothetical protein
MRETHNVQFFIYRTQSFLEIDDIIFYVSIHVPVIDRYASLV